MKNNELNNKENKNFEEGFGMSNEEMNQIVGGSTFLVETDVFTSGAAVEPAFCTFGEGMTGENASGCWVCTSIMFVINGCQTKKKG